MLALHACQSCKLNLLEEGTEVAWRWLFISFSGPIFRWFILCQPSRSPGLKTVENLWHDLRTCHFSLYVVSGISGSPLSDHVNLEARVHGTLRGLDNGHFFHRLHRLHFCSEFLHWFHSLVSLVPKFSLYLLPTFIWEKLKKNRFIRMTLNAAEQSGFDIESIF